MFVVDDLKFLKPAGYYTYHQGQNLKKSVS